MTKIGGELVREQLPAGETLQRPAEVRAIVDDFRFAGEQLLERLGITKRALHRDSARLITNTL